MMEIIDSIMSSKYTSLVFGILNGFFALNSLMHGGIFWALLCGALSFYCLRNFYLRV